MNNEKLRIKSEILQVSEYMEIIKQLAIRFPGLSIIKIATFSFIKKNNQYYIKNVYSGRASKDLVLKYISQMTGNYETFCESMNSILMALDLLISESTIYIDDGVINSKEKELNERIVFDDFTIKAIKESYQYTDRQFMKEVVHNV